MNDLPDATLSPAEARRIDRLCDEFERSWRAGARPRIEDFLEGLAGTERSELLKQLLLLECELAGRTGDTVAAADYLRRFSADTAVVKSVIQTYCVRLDEPLPAANAMHVTDATLFPSHADSRDLLAGGHPDRYQLLDEIGQGGMGVVYRGRDRRLGREVAVKLLAAEKRGDAHLARRFRREAQICSQLQHPGIVPLYDYCSDAGAEPRITMKLVEGQTLSTMLKSASLPQLLSVFEQVCQAVAYAHARGVVHRDLKPGNVMVGPFGEVYVMDWGFARITAGSQLAAAGGLPADPQEAVAPPSVQVAGTPAYMAPEQARGEEIVDPRTDVFGLGAMLCEILTGQPPFRGDHVQAVCQQAAAGDVSDALLRLDRCGADRELVALAKRCLLPAINGRPADALEVARALAAHRSSVEERLRQAQLEKAAAESRATAERRARWLTLALAAVTVAALVAGGWIGLRQWHVVAQVEERAQAALQESLTAREEKRWPEAMAAARRAQDLLASAAVPDALRQEIVKTVSELETVGELERIRDVQGVVVEGESFAFHLALPQYDEVFARQGLDPQKTDVAQAAALLATLPPRVRDRLLDALRDWVWIAQQQSGCDTNWHREVIRASERDAWRRSVGDAVDGQKRDELRRLAESPDALSQSPEAIVQLAQAASSLGLSIEAITLLQGGRRHSPGHYWVSHELGRLLMHAGRTTEAIEAFRAAQSLRPESPAVYANLALALAAAGRWREVVEVSRDGLKLHPSFAALHNNLGAGLENTGQRKQAIECYRKAILLFPQFAQAHSNLALALYRDGQIEPALAAADRAIELKPNLATAHNTRGIILQGHQAWDDAQAEFQKALELRPDYPEARNNLGFVLALRDKLDDAQRHFREAIRSMPAFAEAHFNLGMVLSRRGDWSAARRHFQAAMKGGPLSAEMYSSIGRTLLELGFAAEAVGPLREAVRLAPKPMPPYASLAQAMRRASQMSEAIELFEEFVSQRPNEPELRRLLAALYFETGQWERAEASLEAGLAQLLDERPALKRRLEANRALARRYRELERQLADDPQLPLRGNEALHAAWLYEYRQAYADAVRYYQIAIADLAAEPRTDPLAQSARAALLASDASPADKPLSPEERKELRSQALCWLRAALASLEEGALPRDRTSRVLNQWLHGREYAAVRDPERIARLPRDEQRDWIALWAEVQVHQQHLRSLLTQSRQGDRSVSD